METTEENEPGAFHGDFHMEFCDNRRQLFQAYFRDFTIERLEYPWQAFSGGWQQEIAARKLGINSSFIKGDYSYVLIRVSRFRETARLVKPIPANQLLYEDVSAKIQNMTPGDSASAVQFMNTYGTHYINSYVTGNSLYQVSKLLALRFIADFNILNRISNSLRIQVFVYTKQNYQHIKERLKTRGVAALSRLDLYNFFAPWYAEHLGQIRAASGNTTVEAWAHRKLRLSYYLFTYVSLLKLHGNGGLLRTLDGLLGNEAILALDLKTLTTMFKEPKKREWFQEIIDNYLKLWEVNMW